MIVFINENSVFLVGGGSFGTKEVQSINFDGVADLTDAQEKQWVMLGSLTYDVFKVGVQFFKNKLFILGGCCHDICKDCVQSFDLLTNTTKISGV